MNSKDARAHQIQAVTHSITADHQAHWGFEVLLLPAQEAVPPAFLAACISKRMLHTLRPSRSSAFSLLITDPACRKRAVEHQAFPGFVFLGSKLTGGKQFLPTQSVERDQCLSRA